MKTTQLKDFEQEHIGKKTYVLGKDNRGERHVIYLLVVIKKSYPFFSIEFLLMIKNV